MTYDGGKYRGLTTGPESVRTFETVTGLPVDGSNAGARTSEFGSVFRFRLLPPEALVGALQSGASPNIRLLDAATQSSSKLPKGRQRAYLKRTLLPGLSEETIKDAGTLVTLGGAVFDAANPGKADTPAISDLEQASAVLAQLGEILRAEPLQLLINPQSLRISYTKKQNYSERTRMGFVRQAWGEEQGKLSIEGKIGAFISGAFTQVDKSRGAQWSSKGDSPAFQNLMDLLQVFKHAGYIYDTLGKSQAHLWIGSVAIEYDQWVYIGHIESMNYSYDESAPNGGMAFSLEFTAQQVMDLADPVYTVSPEVPSGPNLNNPILGRQRATLRSPFARDTRSQDPAPLASEAIFK